MQKYYSLSEIALLLNKKPYQITYAISSGAVRDTQLRVAGRRLFTKLELEQLSKFFGQKVSGEVKL